MIDERDAVSLVRREARCPRCGEFVGAMALPRLVQDGWFKAKCRRCNKWVRVTLAEAPEVAA
jgi:hypothetical protein